MNKLLARLTLVFILLQFFQFSITAQTITDELNDNGQSHLLVSSGEVEDFYIPLNPNYNAITFQLDGASGGSVVYGDCESRGGDGAITKFTIRIGTGPGELRPGNYIRFILGKAGPYVSYEATLGGGGAGGGGGSAILTSPDAVTWEILAAAGGGGGAFQSAFITCLGSQNGQGGRVTTSGGNGAGGSLAGDGGTNGDGGEGGGDIGDGDLAGGGGGAFSDGEGTFSKEGKAGFPDGGAGGAVSEFGNNGGWGFGGGGTGDDGGGGGGGYSGGGGGGLNDNGGGGGSYINPLYALSNSYITAGGSGAVTYDGFAYYKFEDICYAELTGFEYIEPYCDETNLATIQMQFDVIGGNECIIDEDLTFRIWPNSDDYTYLGNGRWSGVKTGLHVVYVKNTRLDEEIEERQIIIGPTELPEAKCKDVTVKLIFSEKIVSDDFIDDGSTPGQCDESISLSVSQNTFSCSDIGENTVELTVTGSSGNSSTCESTVTVEEAFPGGAFCKPNYDFDLAGRESVDISISDIDYGSILSNCSLTKNFFGPPTITCSNYSRSVLYRLEISRQDGSVASSCTTLLTIVDSSRPTAACKEEITVDLDDNGLATIEGEDLDNGSIFNGNCRDYGYFELSQSDFDCTDIGDNEVTLIVYNGYDNSSTCTSTVKVQKLDDNPPIAICQDLTLDLNAGETATLTADMVANASTDDCGITHLTIESGLQEFDCSHLGQSLEITVKVEDNAGQTSTCSASVTVADPNDYCNTAPIAVCQDITVDTGDDCQASITAIQVEGGSSDPDGNEMTFSLDQTGPFGRGDHLVTLSVDDGSKSSTCNATITVEDNTPPTAICQDITIQLDANGYAQIYIGDIDNGSYDACGIALSNIDLREVYCGNIGINTKTLDLLDFNGNRASCQATVTVQDNIAPQAICQDLTVQLDAEGNASITAANIDNGSADACGIANLSLDISSFDCTNVGDNWVTMTATDNNSNSSTCQATVTVQDGVAPVALCQNITVQLDDNGQALITATDIDNGSADACGIANLSLDISSFDCTNVGDNALTLTATDNNSNSSNCQATVTVQDGVAPVALCQNITLQLDDNGQALITATDIDNGSNDACGITNLSLDISSFNCTNVGDNAVTLTATDNNSNSSNCQATVTVQDGVAPVALCQNITLQLDDNGQALITATDIDNGSNDACGITNLSLDISSFDCTNVGDNALTLTATDNNSNSSNCQATVTVQDGLAPVALCQNITVQLDEAGQVTITTADIDNESNDACGIATLSLDQTSFTCDQAGDNTVSLSITDNNENLATCQATVTVVDNINPTLTCPQDMTVNTDEGECGAYVTLPKAAPADNCSIKNLKSRYRSLDEQGAAVDSWSAWASDHSGFFELGSYQIQWRAKDHSDNENFCSFQLDIIDEEAPEVICKDVTINFNGEQTVAIAPSSIFDQAASFDACGTVSFNSQSLAEVTCQNVGETLPLQVVGIDPNGNTSNCTAQVTVVGLPCGFEASDMDCENGASANYDPVEESYTLTANDCAGYPQGEYSLVKTDLCGDGEIIAQVSNLSGDGRAGLIMMENADNEARFVSIVKDLTRRTRTEYRSSTGGDISFKSKYRPGVDWLKIVRNGSKFKTYTSTNGYYWKHAHTITFSNFNDCIYVGLLVYTKDDDEPITATFDNVKISGDNYNALTQLPSGPATTADHPAQVITADLQNNIGLNVAPNPFADQTQIEFTLPTASDVTLEIYNLHGQRVQSLESAQLDAGTHRYQWDGNSDKGESLPTGIYMLRLRVDQKWITNKVSLINR